MRALTGFVSAVLICIAAKGAGGEAPAPPPAAWVADASRATIPRVPAGGRMLGKAYQVKLATLWKSGRVTFGDRSVDQFTVDFRSHPDPFEVPVFEGSITLAVKPGQLVDGRTFRQVPVPLKAELGERLKLQPPPRPASPTSRGSAFQECAAASRNR